MASGRERAFHHALITRFNIPFPKSVDPRTVNLEPEWLDERLRLFERYTLPTVQAQHARDFEWLVLCDARTPKPYRSRLLAYPGVIPCWQKEGAVRASDTDREGSLPQLLAERAAKREWLVTTRLDSDDAIRTDFIDVIQQAFRERREILNYRRGYRIRIDEAGTGWVHPTTTSRPNPFTTLIEPAADPKTIYHPITHSRLGELAPVRNIRFGRHWAAVSHGGNVAKERRARGFRLGGPRNESTLGKEFPMNLDVELSS